MPMKIASIFCFLILLQGADAQADVAIPTQTEVNFTHRGKPYKEPVSYTVECFGQMTWPSKPPEKEVYGESKVFSYSAQCKTYPCLIDQAYYLNYRRIDFCNLTGETNGKSFTIQNFGKYPGGKCEDESFNLKCAADFAIPDDAVP